MPHNMDSSLPFRPTEVWTNHFPITRLPSKVFFHYDGEPADLHKSMPMADLVVVGEYRFYISCGRNLICAS